MRDTTPFQLNDFRQKRRALDVTQRTLAEQIGCTIAAISHVERGRRVTGLVARKLARVLADLEAQQERS